MTLQELHDKAHEYGYTIKVEDRSHTDATQVYAIYRNGKCIIRFSSINAAYAWL